MGYIKNYLDYEKRVTAARKAKKRKASVYKSLTKPKKKKVKKKFSPQKYLKAIDNPYGVSLSSKRKS